MCRSTVIEKQECFLIMKTIFYLPPAPKEGGDIHLNMARVNKWQQKYLQRFSSFIKTCTYTIIENMPSNNNI